jgi:acetylornithine/N-succinyldiaminopimelate aminotransferase
VALEDLAILEDEKLLENVVPMGSYLQEELKRLVGRYATAQAVRGRGLIQGLQLGIPARAIVEQALAEGVLFNSTQETVLRFLPPFLLQEKHVEQGIRVLKKLLGNRPRP